MDYREYLKFECEPQFVAALRKALEDNGAELLQQMTDDATGRKVILCLGTDRHIMAGKEAGAVIHCSLDSDN